MQSTTTTANSSQTLKEQTSLYLNNLSPADLERLKPFLNAVANHYDTLEAENKRTNANLRSSANELQNAYSVINQANIALQTKAEEKTQELSSLYKEIDSQRRRFEALVSNSSDITSIVLPDGTCIYRSPSFYNIFCYTLEEGKKLNMYDLVHPADAEAVKPLMEQLALTPGGMITHQVIRVKDADGSYKHLECNIQNHVNDPALQGFVFNCRDVTERISVERKLKTKLRLLEALTANLPCALMRVDAAGKILTASGKLIENSGNPAESYMGMPITIFGELFDQKLTEALQVGFTQFNNSIGQYHYNSFIFKVDDVENTCVAFCLDITEQMSKDIKLQEYATTLEKNNRDLDEFAYIISHDLKAPLRAIYNLSTWIEEDLGEEVSDDTRANFTMMRARLARMEGLIAGVLDYSKAGRGQSVVATEFNAADVVNDIVIMLGVTDTTDVTIAPNMPTLIAPQIKFGQVLQNFISNALKYNKTPNPTMHINYAETDTHHVFSVKDNGPGISPEHHEKIFVIFQTLNARDKIESTGVGLAIVKKIVEEHHGRVWVESQLGQGAEFFFSWAK